ncbi:hypothetical protein CIRG_08178 [Coccidioides immitis RMSCC 2394]|uniref:Uncharacterized protein n=1 Tax=Coccidioides immitis RMSCC 2394 TaxID=404692 RepID=A0A0J6YNM8_COCIT|nr:hypothetical protein CIRG_08178 [Coccidioides immitis RMSCC 2394]
MTPVRQDPHTPPRPINPPSARYGPSHWSSTAEQHATPGADQRARFVVSTCIAASADHQHIRFDDGEVRIHSLDLPYPALRVGLGEGSRPGVLSLLSLEPISFSNLRRVKVGYMVKPVFQRPARAKT